MVLWPNRLPPLNDISASMSDISCRMRSVSEYVYNSNSLESFCLEFLRNSVTLTGLQMDANCRPLKNLDNPWA